MRAFGTIHRGFWANTAIRDAGDDARTLAAYLLTSPHTTSLGAFRLPDAYACDDLGWDAKRLRNGFETLSKIGFARYCPTSNWVWVVKFLGFNKPANPNIWKAIGKMAEAVPVAVSFRDEILAAAGVSETVSKPLGNTPSPSPSQEGETVSIPVDDGGEHAIPAETIAEFRAAYPRIDVLAELRKARAWCVANPAKRKTRRGVGKFASSWLSRANESAPAPSRASQPGGGRRAL